MKKLKVAGYHVEILDGEHAIRVKFTARISEREQHFVSMRIWEYLEKEGFVVEEKTY